jgi:PAS domain S-box-containing protein
MRALLVEDRSTDAELLGRELRKAFPGCALERVDTREGLAHSLAAFAPDIVLSDHSLPQFNAWDALTLVRRERPATPVIIVTGSLDEETAAEYIKAGAADYVVKDRLHRLIPAVQRALALREALRSRERAESERQRSEQRFRKLVEHSSDVITLLDVRGDILYSTQALHPTLGYTPGEKVGQSVFDLVHPEDRKAARALFREGCADPGRVVHADLRLQHRNGTWRRLEVTGTSQFHDPDIGAFVVTYHDVTERKAAEEALRESEERFRQMAETIQEAFFVVNLETRRALYVSPTWSNIWGRPLAEGLDPEIWFTSVHPDDRAILAADQAAVARGEAMTTTFRVIRPAGTVRWVRARAFPVRDGQGRVYRMAGVAEDVTELRQLENQIRQSQKMEAVGRLAGGVAHDFNNLLAVIRVYCDLLLDDMEAENPRRPDLEEVRKAADRAASLTQQLLAFSRQQVLEPRVVDLAKLVGDMANMLQRIIGEDITLDTASAGRVTVRADPGQLEQVLMNLAVNARDAMPKGGRLTISVDRATVPGSAVGHAPLPAGRYAELTVRDTGMGMDEATRAHLFEPFFTTKEKGKGTGLGLATVYGIVKQSGGHVRVESEPRRGATFTVYLPEFVGNGESEAPPAAGATERGGSETILLTEDEASVRTAVRLALERKGYTVLEAADAETALTVATRHDGPIHLLISDVVMPAVGGPDLARRIRGLRPDIRVLLMSGYADDALMRERVPPGTAFIQKPFDPGALARKVREALGGAAAD